MEINHYGDTILGVIASEDIIEGRMVLLTKHYWNEDFGSKVDLPGAKLPDTAAESTKARYCITFAVDNRSTPIYEPTPHYDWALRRGAWDQATNVPFAATVTLTYPGNQIGLTIPSGCGALAFGEGIYTIPATGYIYSAELLIPGSPLAAANTADQGAAHAGKLFYSLTNPVAEVIEFQDSTGNLTFKIYH